MTIYLYVKTHRLTGMKYLGKTTAKNPHKYSGSGKYWKAHLNKHGFDYDTEILRECNSNEEIKECGEYYSNLWNIVESNEWANLSIENGNGGERLGASERMRKMRSGQKPWNKGRPLTQTEKDHQRTMHLGKITSTITKEKQRISKLGKKMSELTKEKLRLAHTGKILSEDHKEKIKIARANQIIGPISTETKRKMSESAFARPVLTCPRCGTTGTGGAMARWHFSQCKTILPTPKSHS